MAISTTKYDYTFNVNLTIDGVSSNGSNMTNFSFDVYTKTGLTVSATFPAGGYANVVIVAYFYDSTGSIS